MTFMPNTFEKICEMHLPYKPAEMTDGEFENEIHHNLEYNFKQWYDFGKMDVVYPCGATKLHDFGFMHGKHEELKRIDAQYNAYLRLLAAKLRVQLAEAFQRFQAQLVLKVDRISLPGKVTTHYRGFYIFGVKVESNQSEELMYLYSDPLYGRFMVVDLSKEDTEIANPNEPAKLSPKMPEAYITGLGTVRPCRICDALVAGGPTICLHCAGNLKMCYEHRKVYQNKVDGQPSVPAVQWVKNGDHYDDDCHWINAGDASYWAEGKVVRRFRLPGSGTMTCQECGHPMDDHGFIDSPHYIDGPGSSTVCPGGFVVEVKTLERRCYYALTAKQFRDWYQVTQK